jgi:hypothetical protein
VRVFDPNIKSVLQQLDEQQQQHRSGSSLTSDTLFVEGELHELTDTQLDDEDEYDQEGEADENEGTLSSTLSGMRGSTPLSKSANKRRNLNRQNEPFQNFIDKNDRVRPYVDFTELERLIGLDENRQEIDDFCRQLEELDTEKI